MPPTKNPRGWKWFFAVLAVLTLAATISLIWYNQAQQLRPEQLDAARVRWEQRRPSSYFMAYKDEFTSRAGSDTTTNDYEVTVKNGKVVEVVVNGIPKTERLDYHDMDGLFDIIERFFELDEKEKNKVFRIATFDPETGALRRYVRRVMGSRERQEINVKPIVVK